MDVPRGRRTERETGSGAGGQAGGLPGPRRSLQGRGSSSGAGARAGHTAGGQKPSAGSAHAPTARPSRGGSAQEGKAGTWSGHTRTPSCVPDPLTRAPPGPGVRELPGPSEPAPGPLAQAQSNSYADRDGEVAPTARAPQLGPGPQRPMPPACRSLWAHGTALPRG